MMRGIAASLLGAFMVACGACGGGDGGGSTTGNATTSAAASPLSETQPALQVVAVEPNPVMSVGSAGEWDSEDVLNPSVIYWQGQLIDYYSGFDGAKWSTGIATSVDNGVTWKKAPSPILVPGSTPTGTPDYPIAANGANVIFNGKVYCYYNSIVNGKWVVNLAISDDGQNFSAQDFTFGLGQPGSFDDNGVADPYVTVVNGTMYMYYEGLNSTTKRQLTGVATSTDGVNWKRSLTAALPQGAPGSFDELAQGEPAVIYTGKHWYMLVVGTKNDISRSIGWASSTDGINWTLQSQSILSSSQMQPWFQRSMIDPTIWPTGYNDGTFYVWFGGGSGVGNEKIAGQIGRMTIKLN